MIFLSQDRQDTRRKRRFLVIALILLLLVPLPLSTVATYTWLAISKTPKVSDMEMTINSNPGLQLAWSADAAEEDWGQQLLFTDAVPQDTLLTPVTYSAAEDCFFTARFGADGRMIDVGDKLNDEMDANGRDGHYVKFTVYGRTEQNVEVSLSPAVTLQGGSGNAGTFLMGTPVWQQETLSHTDGGYGAQYATRVGMRITKQLQDGSTQTPTFFVYEPNADRHIEGEQGVVDTPSVDGDTTLVPTAQLIRQTTTTWQEANPVERDVVLRTPGTFLEEPLLFTLDPTQRVKIEVYIWLEGKDVDCVNALGVNARIFANLQFSAQAEGGSGLVPIP